MAISNYLIAFFLVDDLENEINENSFNKKMITMIKFYFSSFRHSQEVKTLKEILIGLPSILIALNVQERELNNVLDAVSWILKKKKPRFLRPICESFISDLESFDICTIYVKLLESD